MCSRRHSTNPSTDYHVHRTRFIFLFHFFFHRSLFIYCGEPFGLSKSILRYLLNKLHERGRFRSRNTDANNITNVNQLCTHHTGMKKRHTHTESQKKDVRRTLNRKKNLFNLYQFSLRENEFLTIKFYNH